MTALKKLSALLVVLCLALCLVFVVACNNDDDDTSTNTSTDTATDTATDTSTESLIPDGFGIFVCDEDGNGIPGAFVQYCKTDGKCVTKFTNSLGYIVDEEIDTTFYVALVTCEDDEGNALYEMFTGHIDFTEENKLVTITLTAK